MKSVTASICFPSIFQEVMGPDAILFSFLMLSFKPTFACASSRGCLVPLQLTGVLKKRGFGGTSLTIVLER